MTSNSIGKKIMNIDATDIIEAMMFTLVIKLSTMNVNKIMTKE